MENERLTLTVKEAAKLLGLSRNAVYEAARTGKIPVLKIGRRFLIPRVPFERNLLGVLPPEGINDEKKFLEEIKTQLPAIRDQAQEIMKRVGEMEERVNLLERRHVKG